MLLPRGEWVQTWDGAAVRGGGEVVVDAPLERVPVWVRAGSIVVTYPAAHVAEGLGDTPEGPSGRCARRCGAGPGSAAPSRAWPTGRGSAGATAAGSFPPGVR